MPRMFPIVLRIALFFSFVTAAVTAAHAVEFTEISPNVSGLKYVGESWGASWGDFNGDGYPDIFSSNHRARPSVWRNNGDGTFTDIVIQFDTSRTWLDFPYTDTHGGAWGDFDNNGTQDLLVLTGVNFPAALFVNQGLGITTDETVARGIPDDKEGRTATWFDYNNDGLLDVVINNRAPNLFFSQSGGMFSDLTTPVGLQSARTNFGILSDLDQDNSMELLAVADGEFPEKVYKTSTVPFFDITDTIPSSGLVVDAAIADFNNDLFPDIFLVRGNLRPNQALKVLDAGAGETDTIEAWLAAGDISGERGFEFQASGPITVTLHTQLGLRRFFLGAGGYNPGSNMFVLDPTIAADQGIAPHDEHLDQGFYIGYDTASASWKFWLSPASSSTRGYITVTGADMSDPVAMNLTTGDFDITPKLFMNLGGAGFEDVSGIGLSNPVSCIASTVGDFDNDMDLDIYMVCRNGIENIRNRLYLNQGDGTFVEAGGFGAEGAIGAGLPSGAGVGENVVSADYDVDGWLDLYVVNGLLMNPLRVGGPDQLFRNTSSATSTNRWIEIDLEGTLSNRDAIGSKVIVTAGGVTQLREQGGNYHRWSQNHSRIHVGLGQNDTADIEIRWPNGEFDLFTNVSANNLYKVTQGMLGNQTGSISAVTLGGGVTDFPAPVAGDECGVPPDQQPASFPYSFDPSQDKGLFIWKDCSGTEEWFVRASGGGGTGVEYQGQLITNSLFTNVMGDGLESNDIVDSSVSGKIDFLMKMSNSGVDGFDFILSGSNGACLDMLSLPEGGQVFLGGGHLPVSLPLNLNTLESCVNILPMDATVNEGDGTAMLTVTLSRAAGTVITVDYALVGDTAAAGSDYTAANLTGTLTFNPGETSKTLSVDLVQDAEYEQTERFLLELSNASGAFILDSQAEITIEDDDACIACGMPAYNKATEKAIFLWKDFASGAWHIKTTAGGDPAIIAYSGSIGSTQSFVQITEDGIEPSDTLDYTTSPDNIDFVLKVSNTGEDGFVFTPEESAMTCFSLAQPATVLVGQSKTPKSGAFNLNTLGSCLELSVSDVVVSEGSGVAAFVVELSEASPDTVTVEFTTQDGSATSGLDYEGVSTPQTLTFNPGETSKTIDVTILQDSEGEGEESFTLNLGNPVNATLATLSVTATITDDELNACGTPAYDPSSDKAMFVWNDCDTGEWFVRVSAGGDPNGVFYQGQVTSSGGFASVSGYSLEGSDTLDFTSDPASIDYVLKVWNNGDDGFQFVPVVEEGSCLNLESPSGIPVYAGAGRQAVTPPFELGTLASCAIIEMSVSDVTVSEGAGVAAFTVLLSEASAEVVTVDVTTLPGSASPGADYVEISTPQTLTFSPGETSKTVDVTILQDSIGEGAETFTLSLSNAVNSSLVRSSATATITDDELNACGEPIYNTSTDKAMFIWKDCDTGEWTVRVAAGGDGNGVFYQGQLSTSGGFSAVSGYSLEGSDTLDYLSNPSVIHYVLKVWNNGDDGFQFTPVTEAGSCMNLEAPAGIPILAGASKLPVSSTFDLGTLATCTPVDTDDDPSACGMPAFDSGVDQDLYLWRDCGTDNWHMAATAGGAPSQIIYTGNFTSSSAITGVVGNSIEVNDVLDGNPDPLILDFSLKMKTNGFDDFSFRIDSGAETCFTIQSSSPGAGSVLVGSAQTRLQTPIDLATLSVCQ